MFIKQISSYYIDRWGRCMKRTTTFGKYKDNSIAIETDFFKGNPMTKQFIIWNDKFQKIVNKVRTDKGFERIG